MSKGIRRSRYVVGLAVVSTLFAAGCGAKSGGSNGGGDTSEPIRLGVLASYKGPFAAVGPKITEASVQLYLQQHGGKLCGRPVKVITADGETDPQAYLRKARQLVEADTVDAIIGIDHSGALLAVRDYLNEQKIPTIVNVAAAREITNDKKSDYIYRVAFANGQIEVAGAAMAKKSLGYNKVAIVASDYAGAHELADYFGRAYKALGGSIAVALYPPLGTTDFSTYIAKLKQEAGNVDAVVPIVFGADAARFAEQYKTSGISLPVFTTGNYVEQTLSLDVWGKQAIGAKTWWFYSPTLKNPANEEFRAAYQKKYSRLPGGFSATTWTGMQLLDKAGASIGCKFSDRQAVAKALGQAQADSPIGHVAFDDRHQLILNVYLNEVQNTADGPAQVPTGPAVPGVNQDVTVDQAASKLTTVEAIGK